ncbi:MAG: MoaD/ThiS family protein [Methylococcales bacterium]|nr:MoaD/ThiS family protein [Methylococcales bacterium]
MSIRVRYFASLKETAGRSEDRIQIQEPLTAREIWRLLNPDKAAPETMLAAINMEYVSLDALVSDGAELAFFPPVTGG